MNRHFILFLILGLDALFLLYEANSLSVGYSEIALLNGDFSLLQAIVKASLALFGQNDLALRLPMIVLHLLSVLLFFKLSKNYLRYDSDRLWLTLVFVLLPGVLSASIIVNDAGLVIFTLLLYLNIFTCKHYLRYFLLLPMLFVSQSMIILNLALVLYGVKEKEYRFAFYNFILVILSFLIFGFDTTGLPLGHFLDTLAIYAAIFTPIVFVYIFYILYRRYITKKEDILWFISVSALVLSLLLSFRQRLHLEEFAPFILMALPLAAQTFYHSYRVRLKQFRMTYKAIFIVSLLFLFANASIVLFNKYLYCILDDPKENFAYNMNIAKDLALKLKDDNLTCIDANNGQMQARLAFYGLNYCGDTTLSDIENNNSKKVTISYNGCQVYTTYVTNINK